MTQALANNITKFPPKNLIQDLKHLGHTDVNIHVLMPILNSIPIVADANPKFVSLLGELPYSKDKSEVDNKISKNAKKQLDKEFK